MNRFFQIDYKKHKGTLHVNPRGDFDGNSAWELVNLLDAQYDGTQQVVIDTHHLREMCPFGCRMFQCQLKLTRVPAHRIVFEGENGYAIVPRDSRVVVAAQKHICQCSADCVNCPCTAEKKAKQASVSRPQ